MLVIVWKLWWLICISIFEFLIVLSSKDKRERFVLIIRVVLVIIIVRDMVFRNIVEILIIYCLSCEYYIYFVIKFIIEKEN